MTVRTMLCWIWSEELFGLFLFSTETTRVRSACVLDSSKCMEDDGMFSCISPRDSLLLVVFSCLGGVCVCFLTSYHCILTVKGIGKIEKQEKRAGIGSRCTHNTSNPPNTWQAKQDLRWCHPPLWYPVFCTTRKCTEHEFSKNGRNPSKTRAKSYPPGKHGILFSPQERVLFPHLGCPVSSPPPLQWPCGRRSALGEDPQRYRAAGVAGCPDGRRPLCVPRPESHSVTFPSPPNTSYNWF